MAVKCTNPECGNEDMMRMRGVQQGEQRFNDQTGKVDWIPIGPEKFFCWECGSPAASDDDDAVLASPPGRPMKRGDEGESTNLPDMFDTTESE